jgi:hypothetical protein
MDPAVAQTYPGVLAPRRAQVLRPNFPRSEAKRDPAARVKPTLKRVARLEEERAKWRPLLEAAYGLFLPQRDPFNPGMTGAQKGGQVLTSTPARALKKFASRTQQGMLPANRQWTKLKAGMDVPEGDRDGANRFFEKQTEILFQHLNHSNLQTQAHEAILDMGISTGALLVQDGGPERALRFTAVPPHELLVDEGPFGEIEDVFRTRRLKRRIIERNWPQFAYSSQAEQSVAGKTAEEKEEVELDIVEATIFDPVAREFDYLVIEREAKHLGFSERVEESPWVIFRWSVAAGETLGRGPVLDALPDARTLQRVKELVLQNAALAVAGVYTAQDDDVLDVWNISLEPGAVVPVAQHDSLKALETSHDFDVANLIIADLERSIMECMMALELGAVDATPVKTATEWLVREQETAKDQGAGLGRIQSELVMPVVKKAVAILVRRQLLAPFKVDGKEVELEPDSPLSRAQAEEEILRVQTVLGVLAPLGPQVVGSVLKLDVIARKIAEKGGVWREAIRTKDEVDELVQQAQAVAAEAVDSGVPPAELAKAMAA